jgi:hypothetical protein
MNDADAAEAPTTDFDRIVHRCIGAPYSLRTDRVLVLVVEGCE